MNQLGGGRVVVAFSAGGVRIKPGTLLTAEFIKSLPVNNRNQLIDAHYIEVWPKADGAVSPPAASVSGPGAERHVVPLGFGRYTVIEGVMLPDKPLTRAEAYAFAGKQEPEVKKRA
jgi:hypothetical protein